MPEHNLEVPQIKQPVWQRITAAAVLFVILGVIYTVVYGFWVGMSAWADTKPSDADTPERYYLTYIWPVILLVSLIFPAIITLMNTRWALKWLSWITGIIIAFLGWVAWFGVIEFTSK
ncbi:MAG: hypothetical protein J0M37_15580 [Ignavibacteria bacterium]|nr:hypothetical protein [Ignavibacteria bacterium]